MRPGDSTLHAPPVLPSDLEQHVRDLPERAAAHRFHEYLDHVLLASSRRHIIDTMPVVLRYKGFRFFFYSNEGSPREPVHIHVRGEGAEAKLWLRPAVRVAASDGLDARTLRELIAVVEQNLELIERTWHEYFR